MRKAIRYKPLGINHSQFKEPHGTPVQSMAVFADAEVEVIKTNLNFINELIELK